MFPHWSIEYLRDQPRRWLDEMLKMDEIACEVQDHLAEKARQRKAS